MILDALTTTWYENQLRLHEARAYKRILPALTARSVFPVDSQSNPYAKSISFMTIDQIGEANFLADGALDAPMGDVSSSETAYPVGFIATGWDQSNWEIEAARKLGVDLEARQVNAAYDRVNRLINKTAYFGSDARGIPGLLNDADITPVECAGAAVWSAADAAQILEDLVTAYTTQQDNCGGSHEVTDMLLPVSQYNLLATTKLSTTSDLTVLEWLVTKLPFISSLANIHKVPDLKGTLTGSSDGCVLYSKTDECMQMKIPQEIAFSTPVSLGLGMRTFCFARTGGLHIHYPKSVQIIYGI